MAREPSRQVELARCAVQAARGQQREPQLHGALLDAGLLAEVYIRMTRGQDSLVIEAADMLAADLRSGRSTSAPSI